MVWPSSVSLYFVSLLASREVKVVLTGEGSDEMFAGYGRYYYYLWNQRWLRRYGMVPAPLRRAVTHTQHCFRPSSVEGSPPSLQTSGDAISS